VTAVGVTVVHSHRAVSLGFQWNLSPQSLNARPVPAFEVNVFRVRFLGAQNADFDFIISFLGSVSQGFGV
jgi:hypothetical protein